MMECPRCGFVQPEDRYCANCGVDVLAAMAQPKPLLPRIFTHPVFFAGLGFTLVIGIVSYVKISEVPKNSGATYVPHVPENLSLTKQAQNPPSQVKIPRPQAPPPPAEAQAPAPQTPSFQEKRDQQEASLQEEKPEEQKTQPNSPPQSAPTPPAELEVVFAEVPRDLLAQLGSESKILADSGTSRISSVTNRDKAQSLISSGRRLSGGRSLPTQAGTVLPLQFISASASANPQGLFYNVTVIQSNSQGVEIELVGQVNLAATNPIQTRFDHVVTMPIGGALIQSNLLPHRELPEAVSSAFANSPLSIMVSPAFLANETELVSIIHGR